MLPSLALSGLRFSIKLSYFFKSTPYIWNDETSHKLELDTRLSTRITFFLTTAYLCFNSMFVAFRCFQSVFVFGNPVSETLLEVAFMALLLLGVVTQLNTFLVTTEMMEFINQFLEFERDLTSRFAFTFLAISNIFKFEIRGL